MSLVIRKRPASRRSMVLLLLATTAASALLGGCSQSGPFAGNGLGSSDAKLAAVSEPEANAAAAKWAAAYAKKPRDAKIALGYAQTLKAIGSKDRALDVLQAAYQANPSNGELAAELGRLALDVGRMDIAKYTLHVAEALGVKDWKTLSAQGTLHAKAGEHSEAQQYYLAALQLEPDAVSVINNLALSYALDGKADQAETLLRKAVKSGHDDKRVRQNLALVLGVQGKFSEARKVASVDMPEADAKASMAYLRSMLTEPAKVASLSDDDDKKPAMADGWDPYAEKSSTRAPARTAAADPTMIQARTVETPLPRQTTAPQAITPQTMAPQAMAPQAPYQTAAAQLPPPVQHTTASKSSVAMTTVAKTESPEAASTVDAGPAPKGDKLATEIAP